jgi:hypothetical protein
MNVADPEQFASEAIGAIQRQLDAGHRLVSENWGEPGAVVCVGCALTLVAIDLRGVEAVVEAFDAPLDPDEDEGPQEPKDAIASLLGMSVHDVLTFATGFDYPSIAATDGWSAAGRRVRDHFDGLGAVR